MTKLETTLNEEEVRYRRINNYLNNYIDKGKIDIKKLNINDLDIFIEKYIAGESRVTLYSNIKCLNMILKDRDICIKLNSSDYIEKLNFSENKYFNKREIQQLCNVFSNAQDKFIVYALWNGIMGKDYTDLVNLKVTDIVKDEIGTPLYINVSGRKVKCDEFMQEIVQDVLEDDIYYQYTETVDRSYELNMDSEYIIKVKRTKKTNDGLSHMNKSGVQSRLEMLSNIFDEDNLNIKFTGKSLVRSGIMYIMFEKHISENITWTANEIKKWFKSEGLKGDVSEIHRIYHKKYDE